LLKQGRLVPIPAMNNNPEYLKINKDIMTLARAMSMAAPVPMIPITKQLMDIHAQAMNSIVHGKIAAEAALTDARLQAQARLDEYWQEKK
jgi:maltose-binding protein MalE